MEYNNWAELRSQTIELFNGELPHPLTEATIIAAFEQHPDAIARAAQETAHHLNQGTIRTGWGILRTRAQQLTTPPANPDANNARTKQRQLQRAHQWLKTAGLHHDRETELTDDLYNNRGILHNHPDTLNEILNAWRQQRPTAQQLEQDQLARAKAWKAVFKK